MIALFFLALVTGSIHPPSAAVGDRVTVQFSAPVTLDPSTAYEVVARKGNAIVVRTFQPQPFVVSGRAGTEAVRVEVPVGSVLKPKDDLKPAPLKPPAPESSPRMPWIAIGAAALLAIAGWLAVILLARRRAGVDEVLVPAADRYRAAIASLRSDARAMMRWARLADATRVYLAAADPRFGSELTTSEILAQAPDEVALREILHQGDLEKFSPWGPAPADFNAVSARALGIIAWAEPAPAVEEAAA